jgi:hypothetical protein
MASETWVVTTHCGKYAIVSAHPAIVAGLSHGTDSSDRRLTMRRTVILGVLVSISLCTVSLVEASQVCWRLQDGAGNPLLDLLRCSAIVDPATSPPIFSVACSDEADPLYHAVGAGSATQDVEVDFTKYRMGLSLTHTAPGFFGDNRVGSFTALLNTTAPNYLGGTWAMQWAGGPSGPFSISGLLVFLNCPGPLALTEAQKDVGAQQVTAFGEPQAAGIGNFVTLEK